MSECFDASHQAYDPVTKIVKLCSASNSAALENFSPHLYNFSSEFSCLANLILFKYNPPLSRIMNNIT